MTAPRKFRRRQQVIEAIQHDGSQESQQAITEWLDLDPTLRAWYVKDDHAQYGFRCLPSSDFAAEFEPVDTEPDDKGEWVPVYKTAKMPGYNTWCLRCQTFSCEGVDERCTLVQVFYPRGAVDTEPEPANPLLVLRERLHQQSLELSVAISGPRSALDWDDRRRQHMKSKQAGLELALSYVDEMLR